MPAGHSCGLLLAALCPAWFQPIFYAASLAFLPFCEPSDILPINSFPAQASQFVSAVCHQDLDWNRQISPVLGDIDKGQHALSYAFLPVFFLKSLMSGHIK